MSAHGLTPFQARGLRRAGDLLIAGDGVLPAFSRSGAAAHAGRMLEHLSEGDRAGVVLLLRVFALLPRSLARALLARAERAPSGTLRLAWVGIKGTVMTLYYSDVAGAGVHAALGYDPKVEAPDRQN